MSLVTRSDQGEAGRQRAPRTLENAKSTGTFQIKRREVWSPHPRPHTAAADIPGVRSRNVRPAGPHSFPFKVSVNRLVNPGR